MQEVIASMKTGCLLFAQDTQDVGMFLNVFASPVECKLHMITSADNATHKAHSSGSS